MNFCFPSKFPTYKKEDPEFKYHKWWSIWINLPIVFVGTDSNFGDIHKVWKIEAPTGFYFTSTYGFHSFKITFLGFGIGYARQWDY